LTFASSNLYAERALARLFDGVEHPSTQWAASARAVLVIFPYDRHLRATARAILNRAEPAN